MVETRNSAIWHHVANLINICNIYDLSLLVVFTYPIEISFSLYAFMFWVRLQLIDYIWIKFVDHPIIHAYFIFNQYRQMYWELRATSKLLHSLNMQKKHYFQANPSFF